MGFREKHTDKEDIIMVELASILIPAYNAQKFIIATIKSALAQTWPKKEIIIVDDGSTDNTLQIAKKFESKSVKVITQKNRGAPSARNKALSFAQGDYIQWLDNDDLIAPDKISLQLKESMSGKDSRILLSSSFGMFFFRHQKAKFKPNSLWQDLTPIDYFLIKFTEGAWLHPPAWLVSRKLTEMAGPWYERRSPDDDGEYFSRVVAASEKIKFVPEAKSYYRVGNFGSLSQNRSDESLEALFIAISLCINHLRSIEDSERTRAACVKYLQLRLDEDFHPLKPEILEKAYNLAQDLGGNLSPPFSKTWKYVLLNKIFGWKITKNIQNVVRKGKVLTYKSWDKLLHNLSI